VSASNVLCIHDKLRSLPPGPAVSCPSAPDLALLTVGRLAFVPLIVVTFPDTAWLTAILLVCFIAADVLDGVVARRRLADGPGRRALDSIVDRVAIDTGLIAASWAGVLPLPILLALLARDCYLGIVCRRMLVARRVAIKADWLYRLLNLSIAGWAVLVPFISPTLRTGLALGVLFFSLVVAADLRRSVRAVMSAPSEVRDTVLDAAWLRRSRVKRSAGDRRTLVVAQ
jgi:phosphatidylglycerophosphate synthase